MRSILVRYDRAVQDFTRMLSLLRSTDVQCKNFMTPIGFGIAAAFFEGMTMGLLVPMLDLILTGSHERIQGIQRYIPFDSIQIADLSEGFLFAALTALILLVSCIKLFCVYVGQLGVVKLARTFMVNLRIDLFRNYLTFGKLYIDSKSAGHFFHILTKSTADVGAIMYRMQVTAQALALVSMYTILMFIISVPLTILSLLLFPVLLFSINKLVSSTQRLSRIQTKEALGLARELQNSMSNVALIKAYCSEAIEIDKIKNSATRVEESATAIDKKKLLLPPIQELVMLLFLIAIVFLMYIFFLEDRSNAPLAVLFVLLLRRSSAQIGILTEFWQFLAGLSGPIQELIDMSSIDGKLQTIDGSIELSAFASVVKFDGVSFRYLDGRQALDGVSFIIEAGKRVALVGETGAGKSTIMQLLLGFYPPEEGMIYVDDVPLPRLKIHTWRKLISYVSQDALLFNDTIWANLVYGLDPEPSEAAVVTALEQAQLHEFVASLPQGFATNIGDRGIQLSGGEKQRIAIARAFLRNTPIIFLDEPTSALDARTEGLIQIAMNNLLQDRTVLIIAHRLVTIQDVDSILVLDKGRIVEQGSPNDLIQNKGEFYSLWTRQQLYRGY